MSFYRNAVWFVKGLSEYTKGGYLSAAKKFNADDLEVSCKGKSYMITGANSGIGKQVRFCVRKWVWYRFPGLQTVDPQGASEFQFFACTVFVVCCIIG